MNQAITRVARTRQSRTIYRKKVERATPTRAVCPPSQGILATLHSGWRRAAEGVYGRQVHHRD